MCGLRPPQLARITARELCLDAEWTRPQASAVAKCGAARRAFGVSPRRHGSSAWATSYPAKPATGRTAAAMRSRHEQDTPTSSTQRASTSCSKTDTSAATITAPIAVLARSRLVWPPSPAEPIRLSRKSPRIARRQRARSARAATAVLPAPESWPVTSRGWISVARREMSPGGAPQGRPTQLALWSVRSVSRETVCGPTHPHRSRRRRRD